MPNSYSQKGISQILVLLLIFAGIVVGVYLTQKQTNIFPKAEESRRPYIVVFKDETASADEAANDISIKNQVALKHVYSEAIKGFASDLSEKKLDQIKKDPRVKFVSEDRPVKIAARPVPQPPQTLPTGVNRVDAEIVTNTGAGVNVAVIDTGVELNHPDLKANIVANKSCISGVRNGNDDHGHGTQVAGVIAALNNSIGVVGAAPEAKLAAIKVLNSAGGGSWSNVICGLDWTIANTSRYKIKVINVSLAGGGSSDNNCGNTSSDALHLAFCRARDAGLTLVVAAGNDGIDASNTVPAAYDDSVITVSALTDTDGTSGGLGITTWAGADDTFSSFSNFGSVVDIAAPGVDIYTTNLGSSYAYSAGTSLATPHVSAAAALYLRTNPTASWIQVRDGLKAAAEPLGSGHTDPSGQHPEPVVKVNSL